MTSRKYRGVQALGAGRYRVRVTAIDPKTGKQRELDREVTADSEDHAAVLRLQLKDQLIQELSESATEQEQRSRLSDVCRSFLERKQSQRRKDGSDRLAPTTQDRYEDDIEHRIIPFIGDYYADKITRRDVERWRDALGAHYAAATVNSALSLLRQILRSVGSEAASQVSALDGDDTRITDDEPNLLTDEETAAFLLAAERCEPDHYPLIIALFTTGARISTLLALEWGDIDKANGVIHLRRRRSKKKVLPGVKRKRTSKDVVPLVPQLLEAVQEARVIFTPKQEASGLVFPSKDGGYRSRSCLNHPFKRILEAAGIRKRFTPHGCRRTASAMYRRAADSVVAKAISGHLTDKMHAHYAKPSTDEIRRAGERAWLRLVQAETGAPAGDEKKAM